MRRKLYQALASVVQARLNCIASGNDELRCYYEEQGDRLVRKCMPRGGRFDSTKLDWNRSVPNKLVLGTVYLHPDQDTGCTKHTVTIRPDFCSGYMLSISKSNRNDFKGGMVESFRLALDQNEPEEA
jgi:hypothetical protein